MGWTETVSMGVTPMAFSISAHIVSQRSGRKQREEGGGPTPKRVETETVDLFEF